MAKQFKKSNDTANLGFEQKLWLAADKLRGNMDAAEYKHVILGLIFLKYISDSFQTRRSWLVKESADPNSEYYLQQHQQPPHERSVELSPASEKTPVRS